MGQEDFYRGIAFEKELHAIKVKIDNLEDMIVDQNSRGAYAVIPKLEEDLSFYKSQYEKFLNIFKGE